jgi:hypothetical protein
MGSSIVLYRTADTAIRQLKPFLYLLSILVDGKAFFYIGSCEDQLGSNIFDS